MTKKDYRNEDWKKVKVETKKVNELLKRIPTDIIIEQNELFYAGENIVSDKIGIHLRNPNRNIKTEREMGIE